MLVVGFMHLTPACWVVVGILFLLSLAFMAYTYNKVRPRNELKYDFSKLSELSSIGKGTSSQHDRGLQERSPSLPDTQAA